MHVTAEECARRGATLYRPYLDGVDMSDAPVIEAEDGPHGFLVLDTADWFADEPDEGARPAVVLFGAVTLEPIS